MLEMWLKNNSKRKTCANIYWMRWSLLSNQHQTRKLDFLLLFLSSLVECGWCVEEEKELSEINNEFVNSTSCAERCAHTFHELKRSNWIVQLSREFLICARFSFAVESVYCVRCVCVHSLVRDSVQQMNIKVCSRSRLKLMNSPVCSFVRSLVRSERSRRKLIYLHKNHFSIWFDRVHGIDARKTWLLST